MTPYFFGYGSLVNRATHAYPDAQPASLSGWRRTWVQTPARAAVYLSVEPAADVSIDGLIAAVPGADWAALDQREAAYARVASGGAVSHALSPAPDVSHYTVTDTRHVTANPFIVLSYLDIVVQGFLREYGKDGVARFFASTAGWETPSWMTARHRGTRGIIS
ncbi:gamma-glutamylcyclotransferase family protein [Sulfitobacter aestuariivivens]|uniref:gamma-glutamylcyclotransferase family protein n=1 Tax=Sulfitobacter aestuariivivens TaxID=2766981 RepID=UPI003608152A